MIFQLGDDGVVSKVNEEELVYVDKNELEQFIESYHELEKENEQLKQSLQDYEDNVSNWFIENWSTLSDEQRQSAHLELGIEYDSDVE